jgi:hypothetical protein
MMSPSRMWKITGILLAALIVGFDSNLQEGKFYPLAIIQVFSTGTPFTGTPQMGAGSVESFVFSFYLVYALIALLAFFLISSYDLMKERRLPVHATSQ